MQAAPLTESARPCYLESLIPTLSGRYAGLAATIPDGSNLHLPHAVGRAGPLDQERFRIRWPFPCRRLSAQSDRAVRPRRGRFGCFRWGKRTARLIGIASRRGWEFLFFPIDRLKPGGN